MCERSPSKASLIDCMRRRSRTLAACRSCCSSASERTRRRRLAAAAAAAAAPFKPRSRVPGDSTAVQGSSPSSSGSRED
ncbi:rCG55848 [Rattus norvegicus]|uniref:RCG55848 n=1 Tax=Rattus norvegicus TaxID=10116 RepID=A6JMA3_RAT|nr:rCG55848 [Rattus norvegicus]